MSSITVLDLAARLSIYAGTKAFDRIFSLGMQKEYGEYVDVLTVLPMSTKSGMNSGRYLGTVTAAQHGKAVIDTLGWSQKETFGHWYHGLFFNLIRFWPTKFIINRINGRRVEQFMREKIAADAAAAEKSKAYGAN